ncbi:MAG: DUF2953 domain-containing protein [Clostridia bacterium]
MTALYIIIGVLLLIFLLLLTKIRVNLLYCDDFSVALKVLFFKYKLEQQEPQDEDTQNFDKQKKEKKTKKIKKKKISAQKNLSFREIIEKLKDIIFKLIKKAGKYIFLEKYIVKAQIASDDPAKTAILYGAACGAAGSLWALIDSLKHKTKNPKMLITELKPDFISEKSDFYINIEFSIRIWQTLVLALIALKAVKLFDFERK